MKKCSSGRIGRHAWAHQDFGSNEKIICQDCGKKAIAVSRWWFYLLNTLVVAAAVILQYYHWTCK